MKFSLFIGEESERFLKFFHVTDFSRLQALISFKFEL